jgi:hypothetical protein
LYVVACCGELLPAAVNPRNFVGCFWLFEGAIYNCNVYMAVVGAKAAKIDKFIGTMPDSKLCIVNATLSENFKT